MHKSVSDNQHIDKLLLCLEWPEIVAPVGGGGKVRL